MSSLVSHPDENICCSVTDARCADFYPISEIFLYMRQEI
jgi:hypothetical protein